MKMFFKRNLPSFLLSSLFLLGVLFYFGFTFNDVKHFSKKENLQKKERKQRGVHLFGRRVDSLSFQPLIKNNIEWITYVPFGSQKDYDSPGMRGIPQDSIRFNYRDSIWKSKINLSHEAGFKVMLKPHIWLGSPSDGKWRSDIFPTNDDNWELWKTNYRTFILYYAGLAEKTNVELFCIGTEFTRLVIEKPEFWEKLIVEVRNIYSGKITYAANWYKEYENITFWDQLDYIGIQAYFPLVKNKNPTVKEISKGWEKHLSAIKRVHKKFNKKILFTELGYKSTEDSAIEPWTWMDYNNLDIPVSTETQVNCYQAFFNTVWKKKWFAGVHLWQWRVEHKNAGGKNSLDFTPQNKPAEKVIATGFGGNNILDKK